MGEHARRLHTKSGRDHRGDLPACRGIDRAEPVLTAEALAGLRDFAARLDHVQALGATHVQLLPVLAWFAEEVSPRHPELVRARELGIPVWDAIDLLAKEDEYPLNGLLDEERFQLLKRAARKGAGSSSAANVRTCRSFRPAYRFRSASICGRSLTHQ